MAREKPSHVLVLFYLLASISASMCVRECVRVCGCLWHFNSNIKFALEMCCEHFSVLRKVAAHPRGQSASNCRWKGLVGRQWMGNGRCQLIS